MKRNVTLVVMASYIFSNVLSPVSFANTGGHKLKAEVQATNAPGVDANGNETLEGQLGEVFFKGVLNTKTEKGRIKGKGKTTNLSEEKQNFSESVLWTTFLIAMVFIMFGFEPKDSLDFAATITGSGKVRVRGLYGLEFVK